MELNYFKQMDNHREASCRASAVMLGALEGIRNVAWIDGEFKLCSRMNNVILTTLEQAGPEWNFYQKAMDEANEFTHKLKAIKIINGN